MTTSTVLEELAATAWAVALAVVPLAMLFMLFQILFLKLPVSEVTRILKGTLVASIGLFLFLMGVGIGFLPFGQAIGEAAATLPRTWLLVPFGIVLGFVTTWGEPAVRILADQVEEASAGSIPRSLVVWTVCVGVAVAVGVGMFRIGYGVPLMYLLMPGYGLVLVIMWLSEKDFVGISIDAGGVATGPLANTFLLALAFGASSALGHADPLVHGLGLVSLIALAPVLAVMVLGCFVRWKTRQKES